MPWTDVLWRRQRSAKGNAITFAIASVLFSTVVAWNYFVHNGAWRTDEIRRATAVVTDVDKGRRSDEVSVTFKDGAGRSVQADTRVLESSTRVGQQLEVEYTEGAQPLVRVPGSWRPAYAVFGAPAAATLLVALGCLGVHLVRRHRQTT